MACSAVLTQIMAKGLLTWICWLNAALCKTHADLPSILPKKKTKNPPFLFVTAFSVNKKNSTCESSSGMYTGAIKNLAMCLYQTSLKPLLPERNIPQFTDTQLTCVRAFWQYTHL